MEDKQAHNVHMFGMYVSLNSNQIKYKHISHRVSSMWNIILLWNNTTNIVNGLPGYIIIIIHHWRSFLTSSFCLPIANGGSEKVFEKFMVIPKSKKSEMPKCEHRVNAITCLLRKINTKTSRTRWLVGSHRTYSLEFLCVQRFGAISLAYQFAYMLDFA